MAINIDGIVNVNIEIEKPMQDSNGFGVILLVGYAPESPAESFQAYDTYESLEDIADTGWSETDGIYLAAKVAFTQEPKPEKLCVITVQKNTESGEYETVIDALNYAYEESGWYGICPVGIPEDSYGAIAEWVEAKEKIFGFTYNASGLIPVKATENMRTFGICINTENDYDKYMHVAMMATCFGYDPGTETWALKALNTVGPSKFTRLRAKYLDQENINYYVPIGSKKLTQNGRMLGGEWIDVIRFRDWLKNEMQLNVLNLMTKNPKLPFTDAGIGAVDGVMQAVLSNGQTVGGIAPTEFDSEGNEIVGYTTKVPLAANISAEQKSKRKLIGCSWSAKLAGAVHCVEIKGTLSF